MTSSDDQAAEQATEGGWGWFAVSGTLSFMFVITVGLLIVVLGATDWRNDAEATGDGGDAVAALEGERIYRAHCASCHGEFGEGDVGPRLAGVVADEYPDVADQIAIVVDGRGAMTAFGDVLTEEQIRAVVIYERTELGQDLPPESTDTTEPAA